MIESRPRHPAFAAASLAGLLLAGCGGGKQAAPPAPASPAPQAAAPAPQITRSSAPLPAPGQSGLSARHGGLVTTAGAMGLELVADGAGARVYLYDGSGAPLAAADAAGKLSFSSDGKATVIELKAATENGGTVLSGSGSLPAAFDASLEIRVGTETHTVALPWGAAGVEGSSKDVPDPASASGSSAAPDTAPISKGP